MSALRLSATTCRANAASPRSPPTYARRWPTEHAGATCIALPVNDTEAGYAYPSRVRFELAEKDIESYRRAADFLNINSVDLVCLQHEYGIFGGRAGSHILALLRELRMPIVTTLAHNLCASRIRISAGLWRKWRRCRIGWSS